MARSIGWAVVGLLLVSVSCKGGGEQGQQGGAPAAEKGGKKGAPAGPPPAPVQVAEAQVQPTPIEVSAIGNVRSAEDVEVKSRVEGPLSKVFVDDGQRVKQGQLLFQIDPRPFQVALDQAKAALVRDRAQAARAREDLRRYAQLVKQQAISPQAYDQRLAESRALDATVRASESVVEGAQLNLGYTRIESPIAGRLGEIAVHPGDLIKANADNPMVVIRQMQPIEVSFAVPATNLDEIRRRRSEGGELPVFAREPGGGPPVAEGRLTFVDNAVDPATGTIRLKGTFENADEKLWPGEFMDVVLQLGVKNDAVVIPTAAVQSGQQGDYVFVIGAGDKAEMRNIRLGPNAGDKVVIEDGVRPGERVVTDGQLRLTPGAQVAIQAPPPAPPPPGGVAPPPEGAEARAAQQQPAQQPPAPQQGQQQQPPPAQQRGQQQPELQGEMPKSPEMPPPPNVQQPGEAGRAAPGGGQP